MNGPHFIRSGVGHFLEILTLVIAFKGGEKMLLILLLKLVF